MVVVGSSLLARPDGGLLNARLQQLAQQVSESFSHSIIENKGYIEDNLPVFMVSLINFFQNFLHLAPVGFLDGSDGQMEPISGTGKYLIVAPLGAAEGFTKANINPIDAT